MSHMESGIANDQNCNKRKFSLIIHPETSPVNTTTATKAYDITHPYKNDSTKSLSKDKKEFKGRRPLTGNLMMLEQPNDIPVIKVRSMSCPAPITSGSDTSHFVRKSSGNNDDRLKEAYNTKYVEKLKRDLLDFYKANNGNSLEEEVIEEDEEEEPEHHLDDQERLETGGDDDDELQKEDEMNSRMLSSCISNHSSSLTPPLEESEWDISAASTLDDDHKSSVTSENYCDQPLTAKSSMTSIYTTHSIVSTEGKRCNRHHHRRPSCAIKFEEPKIMEWEKDNNQTDDKKINGTSSNNNKNDDDNNGIFKKNYSLQSYVG